MSDNMHFGVTNDFDKTRASLNRLGNAFKDNSKKFDSSTSAFNRMRKGMRNLNQDANTTSQSFKKLSDSMKFLSHGLTFYAVNKLAEGIAKVVQSSMDQIEILNMFEVAMGKASESTDEFLKNMSVISGLDLTTLRQSTGTFTLLAKSMGLAGEASNKLGLNLTQMAIDMSSLYNVPIDQVMADLKSGMVGQSETIYKYGADITEAALQQEAYRLGIERSVRTMGQSDKAFLRVMVMMKQGSASAGDFARTIETPANQVRLLSQNLLTLSRTIGSTLMPVLGAVLPYIRAFVMVLTELFKILGAVFGVGTTDAKNMEDKFGGVSDSADGLGDSMGGATGQAKKLKKAIDDISAPFDELNTVDLDQGDSGSGGGGASIGTGSALSSDILGAMAEYDMLLGNVKQKAMDIRDNILNWLGFQQRINEETGELEWRLENGYTNLEKIRDIAIGIGNTIILWKLGKFIGDLDLSKTKMGEIVTTFKRFGLGMTVSAMFPWVANLATMLGTSVGILLGMVAAIILVTARFAQLWQSNENFRGGVEAIVDSFKVLFTNIVKVGDKVGGFLAPVFGGLLEIFENLNIDVLDVVGVFGGLFLLLNPVTAPIGAFILLAEGLSVALRGIGYMASDAVEEVDIFAGISEKTADKMQPMIDRLRILDDTITNLEFTGIVIDDAIIEDVKTKTKAISDNILNELSSDRNQSLATLTPLRENLGEEMYQELVKANSTYYDNVTKRVKEGQAEIDQIIANSKGTQLSAENAARIAEIQKGMVETTVRAFSESDIEVQRIMNNLNEATTRISLEQASEIIKNAQTTRDETILAAETQYAQIQLQAENMLATGEINKTQYDAMITAAKTAKDETIKNATTQYQTILDTTKTKLGEIGKYLDEQTGNIKTKWQVFCNDMSTFWSGTWDKIKNKFTEWWDNFKRDWNNTVGKADLEMGVTLTGNTSNFNPTNASSASGRRLARGGMLTDGMLFEAGEGGKAELLGSYNNKTTVMPLENSGFVEAMYQAVFNAVSSAGSNGGSVIENALYLDGEVIYRNQQAVGKKQGYDFSLGEFAR